MTVHINQHFAVMDKNHGDEEERCDDVCKYVTGNIFYFMGNQLKSGHLGLAKDGD